MKKNKIIVLVVVAFVSSISAVKLYADTQESKAEKKYTRCAAVRMKEINLDHLEKDLEKYTTAIPEGWTVVSGTGGEGHPKVLICQ